MESCMQMDTRKIYSAIALAGKLVNEPLNVWIPIGKPSKFTTTALYRAQSGSWRGGRGWGWLRVGGVAT